MPWTSADDNLQDAMSTAYRRLREALYECARIEPKGMNEEAIEEVASKFGKHVAILAREESVRVQKGEKR